MNSKIAKQLRKLSPPDDAVSRRVYRRLKKQYNSLPKHARRDFIDIAKETFLKMEEQQSGGILDEEKG